MYHLVVDFDGRIAPVTSLDKAARSIRRDPDGAPLSLTYADAVGLKLFFDSHGIPAIITKGGEA